MTSHDAPPHEVSEKAGFPGRIRVNSQGSTYVFPSTPSPTRENQNHHPYGIKTTSTGILTRSNSNAGAPYSQHSYSPLSSPSRPDRLARSKTHTTAHRYTRSLTTRDEVFPILPPLPSPPLRTLSRSSSMSRSGDEGAHPEIEFASSDSESLFTSPMRRSETIPSLFTPTSPSVVASDGYSDTAKELGLPQNPKYWSPTNLSLYLGTALSAKRGGPLQDHVLRDVQIHVIREKITGRQFMRLSEDDIWDVNSLVKVQLFARAQELRQRAIKGRIYGFKDRSRSPSKAPKYGDCVVNSLDSSPQSDDTCQDESDVEERRKRTGAGWIGRALLPNKSPRGSVGSSSRFSTPSRRSLGRLANEESRGRVKGMIESYEYSSGGRSREGSVSSDFSSTGDERAGAIAAPVPFPKEDAAVEGDYESGETLDPDTTITSPVNYSKDLPPLPESPDGSLAAYEPEGSEEFSSADDVDSFVTRSEGPRADSANLSNGFTGGALHEARKTSSAVVEEEPSMKDLLTETEDYISSHPWEDEIIGETARRVSAVHASVRKSSARQLRACGSFGKNDSIFRTPIPALFTPLPEGDHPLEHEDHGLSPPTTSITPSTAPPSYTDQSVETDLDDIHPHDHVQSNAEVVGLIEVFRNRLVEVERKLDEMERREAQRVLAEQGATLRPNMETVASADELQITSAPPTNPVELNRVSAGVTAEFSKRTVTDQKSAKLKIRPAPKPAPHPEYLPEGIPQFIIGASLGVIVMVVQTLLKRYTGKRP